ncbi:MAG: sensor histidine kinase, partial [Janthinobacterium lividum]
GAFRWFQARALPVKDKGGAVVEWLGTSTDVDDLRQLRERQTILVAELQHRTRNLLGVVRATASTILRTSPGLEDFAADFQDRLGALARVQGLLSRLGDGEQVTFDDLIRTELSAAGAPKDDAARVLLDGPPDVFLRSRTVQTFALALHELATNAAKYGALKQPNGRLEVRWRLETQDGSAERWLHVDWRESGVVMPPDGDAPQGSGAGRVLIEQALPYELGAKTSFVMTPDGVHCSISMAVSNRTSV